jgi:hypothetical protein
VSSRLERLRRGEREALRALLEAHGAALERLVHSLCSRSGADSVDSPLADREGLALDAARAIWSASLFLDARSDERAFVLGAAARATLERILGGPAAAKNPELDARAFADLAARSLSGRADEVDLALLERTLRSEARLGSLLDEARTAFEDARQLPEGAPSRLASRWPELEPTLR